EAARRANPGFDASHVGAVALDLKQNGYDERRGRAFYRRLLEAARALPGAESATLAAFTPMGLLDRGAQRVAIDGYPPRRGEDRSFLTNTVGPGYFPTLRIDLVAGRGFEDRDDETGAPVAVVNDTLARRDLSGPAQAGGKRVRVADGDWGTVVGVAADVKYSRIDEPPRPYVYVPFLQAYRPGMILHVRGPGSVAGLVEEARACVAAQDGDLAFLYARPLAERIAGAFIFLHLTAAMLFVFGVAGLGPPPPA